MHHKKLEGFGTRLACRKIDLVYISPYDMMCTCNSCLMFHFVTGEWIKAIFEDIAKLERRACVGKLGATGRLT